MALQNHLFAKTDDLQRILEIVQMFSRMKTSGCSFRKLLNNISTWKQKTFVKIGSSFTRQRCSDKATFWERLSPWSFLKMLHLHGNGKKQLAVLPLLLLTTVRVNGCSSCAQQRAPHTRTSWKMFLPFPWRQTEKMQNDAFWPEALCVNRADWRNSIKTTRK